MKKVLFVIACLLGLGMIASAETYTLKMSEAVAVQGQEAVWTCEGFTIVADANGGSNTPSLLSAGDLRVYAGGIVTFAVSNGNIESMSFKISKQGLQRYAEITPSVGLIEAQGANPLIWSGQASSVSFTVGALAKYGSQPSKAGQFCFDEVTIVTSAGAIPGGEVPEDDPVIDPDVPVSGSVATYDWTDPQNLTPSMSEPTKGNGVSVLGKVFESNGMELLINKANSQNESMLWLDNIDGIQLRVYKGSTMTFTSKSNREISEIRFYGTQASSDFLNADEAWSYIDVDGQGVWTPNSGVTSVVFDVISQIRLSKIDVIYATPGIVLGDVNGDCVITISDVVAICNIVLGNKQVGSIEEAADVNGDGEVTVADVVKTVNIILSKE